MTKTSTTNTFLIYRIGLWIHWFPMDRKQIGSLLRIVWSTNNTSNDKNLRRRYMNYLQKIDQFLIKSGTLFSNPLFSVLWTNEWTFSFIFPLQKNILWTCESPVGFIWFDTSREKKGLKRLHRNKLMKNIIYPFQFYTYISQEIVQSGSSMLDRDYNSQLVNDFNAIKHFLKKYWQEDCLNTNF